MEKDNVKNALEFMDEANTRKIRIAEHNRNKEDDEIYSRMETDFEARKEESAFAQNRVYLSLLLPELAFQFVPIDEVCGAAEDSEKREELRGEKGEFKPFPDSRFLGADTSGELELIPADELMAKSRADKTPLVDGLLNPGCYIFAGAPKVGKSFAMSEIAYHVAAGKELWGRKVNKGGVLYLALEDDDKRLKERLSKMFGEALPGNLYLTTKAGDIEGKLFLQLQYALYEHPDIKLVIIDTLAKIRTKGSTYARDYQNVGALKKFADTFGLCVLLVHHTTKTKQADIFNSISGSTGLTGAADGAFVMYKNKRVSSRAVLDSTGRDAEDMRLFLKRDPETLVWDLDDDPENGRSDEEELLEAINAIVDEKEGMWEGTPTELARKLNSEKQSSVISKKIKANADELKELYGIDFESFHGHSGRTIVLTKLKLPATEDKEKNQ